MYICEYTYVSTQPGGCSNSFRVALLLMMHYSHDTAARSTCGTIVNTDMQVCTYALRLASCWPALQPASQPTSLIGCIRIS